MPRPKRPDTGSVFGAILGDVAEARAVKSPRTVGVAELSPSPFQPRRQFDDEGLARLAASIREQGVLQPIVVRFVSGRYEVVAGERRLRAARLANLTEVPVEVRDLDDRQAALVAAVENLQREDLSVIDEVDATLTLVADVLGVDSGEARSRLNVLLRRPEEDPEGIRALETLFGQLGRGTWQSFAKNRVRVLNWPEAVLAAMREHGLGFSVAGVVAGAPRELQADLLERALGGATHADLRAELSRRSLRKEHEETRRRVLRRVGSARELARLDEKRRAELLRLLERIDALFETRS
ncbi:ParB/RepB/Spo0J family partition protein [Deinococcus pimensis]|uniref:ParB/RepB/Spo0J family partition protein n=1 Tax=Deinococcus pimensis TaxID=309888 RepID=UPI0004BC8846|nr:ParB/RepB/Spo0J family partition protein [Deinococcus pimensis]